MNHIEVLMEYKYMQKKPDPGLNYTEFLRYTVVYNCTAENTKLLQYRQTSVG